MKAQESRQMISLLSLSMHMIRQQRSYSESSIWREFGKNSGSIQDKTIPRLLALKKVPNSTLVNENIVHSGDIYDFHGWYCALALKKSAYENAQSSCMEMEGLIQDIQMKILASIEELLGVNVSDASGLHLAELRDKIKFMYFLPVGLFEEESDR